MVKGEATNEELFRKAGEWAIYYANEILQNEEINDKPEAIKYRVRAVKQFLTELERRANEISN